MKITAPILAVCLAGAVAGCAGPASVNTVGPKERSATPTPIEDERLITDPLFARQVPVIGLIEGETDNGLRIVEAEIRNATRIHRGFRYRFTWYGADGLEIRSPTSVWVHESIPPGALRRLTGIAPDRDAHDFRLEILADQ